MYFTYSNTLNLCEIIKKSKSPNNPKLITNHSNLVLFTKTILTETKQKKKYIEKCKFFFQSNGTENVCVLRNEKVEMEISFPCSFSF